MDDWLQVIFAIFAIAVTITFFFGIKSNITTQINQHAETSLEKAESLRILLDFINSLDENGNKATDLLALSISKNDYKEFGIHVQNFFKSKYKDETKVTWMIRIESPRIHEAEGPNFSSSDIKIKISSIRISLPNGEISTISLHKGENIIIPVK